MLPSESRTVMRADTEAMPVMRWGAIIGGWMVATGIASMLYVAGLAMGFSALDPNNAEVTAKGLGLGTAGWMVLTWVVSLLLGGMFASWFDGRNDPTMGALHGVTVWGLSITASGLLLALGLTQAAQGVAPMLGVPHSQTAQRAMASNDLQSPSGTMAQNSQGTSGTMAPNPQNAPGTAPGAQGTSAQPTGAAPGTSDPAKAEAAKRYTAAAMWAALASILLALVASGIGGWLGASHVHRVHHLRRYDTGAAPVR